MSIQTSIKDNIKNIREEDLEKFAELAFNKGHEGDDFAKGFDYALSYLSGNFEYNDIREHLE